VVQQVPDANLRAVLRKSGEELPERIIKGQQAAVGQQQDDRRRELFAHRSQPVVGFGGCGLLRFESSHSVGRLEYDTALARHQHVGAGYFAAEVREERVHLVLLRASCLRKDHRGREQEYAGS